MPKDDDPVSTPSISSKKRTIKDLYATSPSRYPPQSWSPAKNISTLEGSSKRAKLQSHHSSTHVPLPASQMYSFPKAKRPPPAEVIDLTGSDSLTPASTPTPPRRLAMASIVTPQIGAKRLVVKNQRPSQNNTKAYYDQVATKTDTALDVILDGRETARLSLEDLYQSVRNVCRQGYSSALSARLIARMKSHAIQSVRPRITNVVKESPSSEVTLEYIISQWTLWLQQWSTIRSIYYFMDTPPLTPLMETCVALFLDGIMNVPAIKKAALDATAELIANDRARDGFNAELCQASIQMFTSLGLYTETLEPTLLNEAQSYVAEWAAEKSESESLSEYIKAVIELLDTEMLRCEQVGFSSSTKRELQSLLEKGAIEYCQDRLAREKDVYVLLDDDAESVLGTLYSLLRRRGLSKRLLKPFESWIKKTGIGIVFDEEREDDMVVRLLSLYKQVDRVFMNAFQRDKDFTYTLRTTFEEVMNKTKKSRATHHTDNTKQGEMIAKYVDLLLRGGYKAIPASAKTAATEMVTDEEQNEVDDHDSIMNDQLDQVLDLFRYLQGKAVFEAFYKKDLARRLLMGRSASADAELSMLTRLKNECGDGFTFNLETMFKDIELSKEEMTEYKSRMNDSESRSSVDLSVNILSKAAWPSYPDIKVNIPQDVVRAMNNFETSYKAHHSGRTLDWKHGLAHCQLKATFPKATKELVVSGFQAVVLLLFNKERELSYDRILAETGLRKSLQPSVSTLLTSPSRSRS